MLKVSELNHSVKERAYQDGEVESVEKEWEKFRDMVMECSNDVCGMKRVGGSEERGGNGGMKKGRAVAKREELLRNGFREEIGLPMTDTGHREWRRN